MTALLRPQMLRMSQGSCWRLAATKSALATRLAGARRRRWTACWRRVLDTIPAERLAGHFHDTSGRALANIGVALERGIRVFDASAGGLGGCPYAPGARGNVDTLKVDGYVRGRGFVTGLNVQALEAASVFARGLRSPA